MSIELLVNLDDLDLQTLREDTIILFNFSFDFFLHFYHMIQKLRKSCAIDIESNALMSCLSLATMTLLIFASIVMMTIISVTPIIILGIG
jgi:hypothetical protein